MKDTRFEVSDPDTPRNAHDARSAPVYKALDLTDGGKRAQIVLGDQVYTLSITRSGKLILTK